MKTLAVTLFALLVWLSAFAVAQELGVQQPSSDEGSMSQGQTPGKKAHLKSHLMGKISEDGKTLTDNGGKSWSIDNPDAVKGHEGYRVTLRGRIDTTANTIHVTSVTMSGKHGSNRKGMTPERQPQ